MSGPDLEVEVSLNVTDIIETQTRLVWILASGIVGIAVLGTIMGSALARRISQPLVKLGNAAANISKGDLKTPVDVDAQVGEVALVAHALETARGNLLHTLNDLQREKAWTDQLLESIVEGIMTLDERYQITFFSHGAERITSYNRGEVLGRSIDEIFHLAGTKAPFRGSLPAPGQKNKIVVELADRHWVSLAVTGARLSPSGAGEVETAFVFRDVSSEEIIHQLLASFIGNVAHEFRTPSHAGCLG
jgi:PAS domain S-box-containing protein